MNKIVSSVETANQVLHFVSRELRLLCRVFVLNGLETLFISVESKVTIESLTITIGAARFTWSAESIRVNHCPCYVKSAGYQILVDRNRFVYTN